MTLNRQAVRKWRFRRPTPSSPPRRLCFPPKSYGGAVLSCARQALSCADLNPSQLQQGTSSQRLSELHLLGNTCIPIRFLNLLLRYVNFSFSVYACVFVLLYSCAFVCVCGADCTDSHLLCVLWMMKETEKFKAEISSRLLKENEAFSSRSDVDAVVGVCAEVKVRLSEF